MTVQTEKVTACYPKSDKPRRLEVYLSETELFYTHTIPAGETDFVIKFRRPCMVVVFEDDKAVCGAHITDIVVPGPLVLES